MVTTTSTADQIALPPGPPPRPKGIFGSVRYYMNFISDPIAFITQRFEQYGDLYCARNPDGALFVVRHPDHIQEVLLKRADDFSKTHTAFDSLKQVLGDALLTSDGENWKRQRRLVQPAFVKKRMQGYGKIMTAETQHLLARWQPDQVVDMSMEMVDLTLRIVCSTLFSYQVSDKADQVANAMKVFNRSMATPSFLPGWVPSLSRKRVETSLAMLDDIIYDMIKNRRDNPDVLSQPNDLLQRLVTAVDTEGGGDQLSAREIRDQLMTLFLAGHETTSHALTWCWYLLANNPGAAQKLRHELDQVLEGRPATYDDLPNLPYTEQVFREAMRLYPPAYVLARRAKCDTEVGGYSVPAGSELVIWLYMTHHDERWYPEPETFKPERFTPEAMSMLPKLAYLPFGAGPRTCIGAEFAMVEARLILATLAQSFDPQLLSKRSIAPKPRITLAPKTSVKMLLKGR